jgi:site-specific recombinase XerD
MQTTLIIDEFLTSLFARGRADRTIGAYRQRFQEFAALPADIEQIQPRHVDCLLANLRARGLAAASIASYIQTLRTFFRWCVVRGHLPSSPAGELRKPKLEYSRRGKAVPQADLLAAIAQARREEHHLGLAVLLMLADSGCRAGELVSLNLQDLDLEKQEAACRGKTGERMLDYTSSTAQALAAWIAYRPQTDCQAVFMTQAGRLTIWGLYKLLWGICKRAGVKRFGPQAVRHRVGQGWIDAGANLELVRIKLGHKDISTTSRYYAHQDRARMKSASRRYSLVH